MLVVSTVAALAAALAAANLPLEGGRSRGDEHTSTAAEAGLGEENEQKLPVGTSGETCDCHQLSAWPKLHEGYVTDQDLNSKVKEPGYTQAEGMWHHLCCRTCRQHISLEPVVHCHQLSAWSRTSSHILSGDAGPMRRGIFMLVLFAQWLYVASLLPGAPPYFVEAAGKFGMFSGNMRRVVESCFCRYFCFLGKERLGVMDRHVFCLMLLTA